MIDPLTPILENAFALFTRRDYKGASEKFEKFFKEFEKKYNLPFEKILRNKKEYIPAAVSWAISLIELGNREKAANILKIIDKVTKRFKGYRFLLLYGQIRYHVRNGDYESVIEISKKIKSKEVINLAKKEIGWKDVKRILRMVESIEAEVLAYLGDYEKAEKILKRLAKEYLEEKRIEEYLSCQFVRVKCYEGLKRWWSAEELCNEILSYLDRDKVSSKYKEYKADFLCEKIRNLINIGEFFTAKKYINELIKLTENEDVLKEVGGLPKLHLAILSFIEEWDVYKFINSVDTAIRENLIAIDAKSLEDAPEKLKNQNLFSIIDFIDTLCKKAYILAIYGKYESAKETERKIEFILKKLKDNNIRVDLVGKHLRILKIEEIERIFNNLIEDSLNVLLKKADKKERESFENIIKNLEKKYKERKNILLQNLIFIITNKKIKLNKIRKRDSSLVAAYINKFKKEISEIVKLNVYSDILWKFLSNLQEIVIKNIKKTELRELFPYLFK